jgi:hypothetical protein
MKKIITSAAIVLFSSASNAEWKKLDCIDNTNFSVYIQFDEQAQAVKLGDEEIIPATITNQSIHFRAKFPNGQVWIHTINRTTGVLRVKLDTKDGVLLPPYYCKPFAANERKF